jgi:hypothetical protein
VTNPVSRLSEISTFENVILLAAHVSGFNFTVGLISDMASGPSWEPDCVPYSGWDCYGAEYNYTDAEQPSAPEISLDSVLVIYLRDGPGYGATDYWVADGKLNFVTTYGGEKAVAFKNINWQVITCCTGTLSALTALKASINRRMGSQCPVTRVTLVVIQKC